MFLLTLYISLKTLSHSESVSRKRLSGQEDFAHLSVFLYPFISFCPNAHVTLLILLMSFNFKG